MSNKSLWTRFGEYLSLLAEALSLSPKSLATLIALRRPLVSSFLARCKQHEILEKCKFQTLH